jgi:GT2 family glycosyltransferase
MTRLTVSIVNWNTREPLRRCLQSLPAGLSGIDADVVVVDNCSSDGTGDMVQAEFPHVRLMRSTRNLGFAGGNNAALEGCTSEYALILNPDVELSPGSAQRLIGFLEAVPGAAAVSPALVENDGSVQTHMYRRFPSFMQVLLFWTVIRPRARRIAPLRRAFCEHGIHGRSAVTVDQLPGAAMMIRGSALRTVGPLDPGYFIWWEDVDWSYRARQAGFTLHVLPDVPCRHAGGASFAQWTVETRVFQFYRAFYRFLAVHALNTLARRVSPVIMADLAIKEAVLGLRSGSRHGTLARTKLEIRRIMKGMEQGTIPYFHSAQPDEFDEKPLPVLAATADFAAETDGVTAVIVNWNGRRYLHRCIVALTQSTIDVRIIVVDNASTDSSADYVRRTFPDVELIEAGHNCGYAAGANLGLRHARTRYVLVMNPDVLVEADHIEVLRDRLDASPHVGVAQGKLFSLRESEFLAGEPSRAVLDSAGHVIRRSRMVVDRGQGDADGPQYSAEVSIFSACGAALFLRSAMLRDVAPDGEVFCEAFFTYKEDIDLGWRARLSGWDILYIPKAVAHHVRAVPLSSDAWRSMSLHARRHSWKNHDLLMTRNARVADMLLSLPFIAGWELLRLGHALLRDPRVLVAYVDLVREIRPALRARRDIQRRRRASVDDIRRWFGGEPDLAAGLLEPYPTTVVPQ